MAALEEAAVGAVNQGGEVGAGADAARDGPLETRAAPTRQVRTSSLPWRAGAAAWYDGDGDAAGAADQAWDAPDGDDDDEEEALTGSRADTRVLPTRQVRVTNFSSPAGALRGAAGAGAATVLL